APVGGQRTFAAPPNPRPRPRPGGDALQVARNRIEDAGQAVADRGERADGGNRDQGGDQTVFDCRRAAIVTEKTREVMKERHWFYSQADWTPQENTRSC